MSEELTRHFLRLTGQQAARLFRTLDMNGCQVQGGGLVWWFSVAGLRLELADGETAERPFRLYVQEERGCHG